jgi:bifunctional aspartokinase / homoserine dehydrogenase 1
MPIASKRQQRFTHVMKLGGSTVGRAASLSRALEIVAREATAAPLALVVSAFGDSTDELVAAYEEAMRGELGACRARVDKIAAIALEAAGGALAVRGLRGTGLSSLVQQEVAPLRAALGQLSRTREGSAKLRDEVLAHGELLSAAVVAHVLSHAGLPAVRVDARTWLTTDDRFGDASALEPETSTNVAQRIEEWLGEGRPITVHTGFLERTARGETTTLGRNGSDYSAALLAEAIGAKELTVLTDVPGVMTADPAIVPEAYTVPRLTYHEALELAGLGLRMLHPRTVLPLAKAGIPMTIVDTMRPIATGTRVDEAGDSNERRPTCIASLEGMTLLDVEATRETGGKNVAALALGILAAAAIDVWLTALAAHGQGVALVVRAEVAERAAASLDGVLGEIATTRSVEKVAIVTLVAEAMGRTPNVAGRFFAAIGASGICVRASSQGASSRAISCVVDEADLHAAVRAVHAVMNLAPERIHLLVLGKGTVGSQVLAQLEATREARLATHDVDLRLVGLADRRASVFDERTLSPSHAREALLSKVGASTVPADVLPLLERLAHLPSAVLVDCTAADGMADVYAAAFARGIHVVTANKKPLTGPSRERTTLFEAARKAHRTLRYETTVGASLPVVETPELGPHGRSGVSHRRIALRHARVPVVRGHEGSEAVVGRTRGPCARIHRATPARGSRWARRRAEGAHSGPRARPRDGSRRHHGGALRAIAPPRPRRLALVFRGPRGSRRGLRRTDPRTQGRRPFPPVPRHDRAFVGRLGRAREGHCGSYLRRRGPPRGTPPWRGCPDHLHHGALRGSPSRGSRLRGRRRGHCSGSPRGRPRPLPRATRRLLKRRSRSRFWTGNQNQNGGLRTGASHRFGDGPSTCRSKPLLRRQSQLSVNNRSRIRRRSHRTTCNRSSGASSTFSSSRAPPDGKHKSLAVLVRRFILTIP